MRWKKWVGKVLSFTNYFYKTTSVFHHPAKKVLQPAYVVTFNPKETDFLTLCAHSFNYQIDYALGFRQKEVYTVPLQQVTFLGNSGALLLQDSLITESVFDSLRLVKSSAFKTFSWLGLTHKKKGFFTSVMHLPWAAQSNYHWFLDCLPRLYSLLDQIREPIQIIVPRQMPAFQRETLAFLLKDHRNFTLLPISKHEKWHLTDFIFPSFVSNHNSGYLPTAILQQIREKTWRGYGVEAAAEKKKLFISRRKASKRRVLNEEALVQLLRPYGFQVIFAEALTYQEQVQLFYNAEYVVAPHGAGLTNILFSKKCKVWELHPADVVKSHYFMLCKALAFDYFYSIGTLSGANLDFEIDEAEMAATLPTFLSVSASKL